MKQNYLSFLLGVLLLCCGVSSFAQFPNYHYTPKFQPPNQPLYYNYGNYGQVSMKHHFTIVFSDGRRDTTVYTKLVADSPAYYLTMENKSVGKKDSGRIIKIYPSQTKSISHVDPTTGDAFVGVANDSCWLFKVIGGKINAYTNLAEIAVEDDYIRYLQLGDGPLVAVADPAAGKLFEGNQRAQELFEKKHYNRAVNKFNKIKEE